jgi:Gram-negative bacterial TonB protein C-terminal
MKFLAVALAATLAAATLVITVPPAPARANVFCPVTIAAVQNLAILGRQDTYGVLLDIDPGDVTSVRMRVDSATTRYAVDFDDIGPIGEGAAHARRYFVMPPGERLVSAWIEDTGLRPDSRMECPITHPYAAAAPQPVNPRTIAALEADRRSLRDSYSTKTPTAQPKSFGPASSESCNQPFAPPRAILPVQPDVSQAARAVHASGTTVVRVDLDETSTVVGSAVVRSRGYAPPDRAALDAAVKSSYRTESFACRPVASTYQFTVTFGS